jgi:molybdate transport system substrate-binding protein
MRKLIPVFILVTLIVTACASKQQQSIVLFAGMGMKDAVEEIASTYEKASGIKVKINLACSATLAKQLKSGAKADVVVFASKQWADYSDNIKAVKSESRETLAGNKLVVIAPKASEMPSFVISKTCNFPMLFSGRLSIGDPESVPAGKYCIKSLKYYGWEDDLKSRLLPAKDVRAALRTVELGETEAGVVYASDAFKSDKVKIVAIFPEESHPPIRFICFETAQCTGKTNEFYKYFTSGKAKLIWRKHGFEMLEKEGSPDLSAR